jgi:hypothetical protein
VLATGFGGALHRSSCHLQTGQHFHLFTALIEGRLLRDQSVHAPHAGREIDVRDVQFVIGGELTLMTMGTQEKTLEAGRTFWITFCAPTVLSLLRYRSVRAAVARNLTPGKGQARFWKLVAGL